MVGWLTLSCSAISVPVIDCANVEATFLLRSSILNLLLLLCMLELYLYTICRPSQNEAFMVFVLYPLNDAEVVLFFDGYLDFDCFCFIGSALK
jgi:hypothetical protein